MRVSLPILRQHLIRHLTHFWTGLRQATGDDAYERYLEHWQTCHAGQGQALSRRAFFKAEQERKWNGIRRCC